MDPRPFDRLVQTLPEVVSRRRALRGLGALALGSLGIVGISSRAAAGCHHGVCACRKHESKQHCKRRCMRQCR
jgi:hypothetical protein